MLNIIKTKQFLKSSKKMLKRGRDLSKLQLVVGKLSNEEELSIKYKDHKLIGNYQGFRECHIEPDWLLIYKITEDEIILYNTGTHSDLF